jgi:predicted NBD/HSP70 family sugar kinase
MQALRANGQNSVREANLAAVLRIIHEQAPVSRARLAALTGLNKSTVSSLVEDLLRRGLVHETGVDAGGQGRPATLLNIQPQGGALLGVEFGVDYVRGVLAGLTGAILWRERVDTNPRDPMDSHIRQALALVDRGLAAARTQARRLTGIGLALPGMVDVDTGTLTYSPNLQWRNAPFGAIFHAHTGLPVCVENDANAGAMGEHIFGQAKECRHFIFIAAGVGIGGGLFLNGSLYRGVGGFAGEIGHTQVSSEHARLCRCGIRGCWENSCNQYALIERLHARLDVGRPSLIARLCAEQNSPLTLAIIAQAAGMGDAETLEALHETGQAFGRGIANLINTFNPERVILGGAMSVVSEYMLPGILSVVHDKTLREPGEQATVRLSSFGTEAGVIGAAALVMEAVLSNPLRMPAVEEPRRSVDRD